MKYCLIGDFSSKDHAIESNFILNCIYFYSQRCETLQEFKIADGSPLVKTLHVICYRSSRMILAIL